MTRIYRDDITPSIIKIFLANLKRTLDIVYLPLPRCPCLTKTIYLFGWQSVFNYNVLTTSFDTTISQLPLSMIILQTLLAFVQVV